MTTATTQEVATQPAAPACTWEGKYINHHRLNLVKQLLHARAMAGTSKAWDAEVLRLRQLLEDDVGKGADTSDTPEAIVNLVLRFFTFQ